MILHLFTDGLIMDTRAWKTIEIRTWEAYLQVFIQESQGMRMIGILVKVLIFDSIDLLELDTLVPHTSVEVEVLDDNKVSIELRSGL